MKNEVFSEKVQIDAEDVMPQIIYLDFDGASTVYHNDHLNLDLNVDVEDSGMSDEQKTYILSELTEKYAGSDILFTTEKPTASTQYSTVFIGETVDFDEYGDFSGISETIDENNKIKDDNAFVFADELTDLDTVINVIDHEIGHIVGGKKHKISTGSIYDYAAGATLRSAWIEDHTITCNSSTFNYDTSSFVKYYNTSAGYGVTFTSKTVFSSARYTFVDLNVWDTLSLTIKNTTPSSYTSRGYNLFVYFYIADKDLSARALASGLNLYTEREKYRVSDIYEIKPGQSVDISFSPYNTSVQLYVGNCGSGKNVSYISQYTMDVTVPTTANPDPTKADLCALWLMPSLNKTNECKTFDTDDTIYITVGISNESDIAAGESTVKVVVGNVEKNVTYKALGGRKYRSVTVAFNASEIGVGTQYVSAYVDYQNQVSESKENNNYESAYITIKEAENNTVAPSGITSTVNKYKLTLSWDKLVVKKGQKVSYSVSIEGLTYYSKSQKMKFTVTPGNYSYKIRGIISENGKNDIYTPWSQEFSVNVSDITAPKMGKVKASQISNSDSVNVTWNAASDNSNSIQKYVVTCGTQTKTVDAKILSCTFDNVAGTRAAIKVVAYDKAGLASTAKKYNLKLKDVIAPGKVENLQTVSISAKYKGTFCWNSVADNSGKPVKYQVKIDGSSKYIKASGNNVKISKLSIGTHTLQVRAIDNAKNPGEWSDVFYFKVTDVTAPKKVSVKVKVANNDVTLKWKTPADNVGVTRYVLRYGNVTDKNKKTLDFSGATLDCVLSGLDKGTYEYELTAFDAAANASEVKTGKFNIKNELTEATVCDLSHSDNTIDQTSWSEQTDAIAYSGHSDLNANVQDIAITAAVDLPEDSNHKLLTTLLA